MSAKHTPGPWRWEHNTASNKTTHCIDVTAEGGIGGVAYIQSYTDYDGTNNRDETLANARLIAASPCLLEALEEVEQEAKLRSEMDYYERLRGSTFGIAAESDNEARAWQARQRKIEEIVVRRRAAIARATGGTDAA